MSDGLSGTPLHNDGKLASQTSSAPDNERIQPFNVMLIAAVHLLAVAGIFIVSWPAVIAGAIAHFLASNIGTVLGMHRYFSHKSFRTSRWFENVLGTLGTLALQGGPIRWAAVHREHHRVTDTSGDAHAASRGFWWSHVGWLLVDKPNGFSFASSRRVTKDLRSNGYLLWLERHYLALNAGVAVAGFLVLPTFAMFLWVFPVRIVIGWHLTWLINSYTHRALFLTGTRDQPAGYRNSMIISVLILGEGWHENHHRFPSSPSNSLKWWQFDPGYWILSALQSFRIIKLRKVPTNWGRV